MSNDKLRRLGDIVVSSIISYPQFFRLGIELVERISGKPLTEEQRRLLNLDCIQKSIEISSKQED